MTTFTLSSSVFESGESIPDKYGYDEENVNPPLTIDGVPDGAETLALVIDDPDAMEPAGKVWDHWTVWNIPPSETEISEGWTPREATEGTNDYGEVGYGGPKPPDGEHTYQFEAFALDTDIALGTGATKAELESAIDGQVLARAQYEGTYAP